MALYIIIFSSRASRASVKIVKLNTNKRTVSYYVYYDVNKHALSLMDKQSIYFVQLNPESSAGQLFSFQVLQQ